MYFKTKFLDLYYEKYGDKKQSILILPGWGDTRNTFRDIINYLKENYTVYIIDYPGFGNSSFPENSLMINDYAIIILDLLKYLEINNPIIIAHSFGGRVTALLLGKYKLRVKKIILMDVAGIKRRKSLSKWLKEKCYKILKNSLFLVPNLKREEYRQKLLLYFGSSDYISLTSNMRETFQNIIKEDLREYYKKIDCETLLLWGELDYDTPLKDGYYLRKKINNSSLIVYQNAGHFCYLNQPLITIEIIKEYFK